MAQAQNQVEKISFDELMPLLKRENSRLKVVNFWATWCRPCVAEMPHFEALAAEFEQSLEVIYVSLDDPATAESRVQAFVEKKGIANPVYVLTDTDPNTYVDRVDPSWSGSLPATILFPPGGGTPVFHEGDFSAAELHKFVQPHLPAE